MKSRPIPVGVVDTGLAGGIHNAAVDRACLALRAQGHGSVLLDADIATMLKTLRVPTEKLSPHGLAAARERLTTVNALRGEWLPLSDIKSALMNGFALEFGLDLHAGDGTMPVDPTPGQLAAERSWARSITWHGGKDLKTEALIRPPGGTLRARAYFTPQDACLHGIEFAANMQITTITNYEHLVATLTELKARRVEAYAGTFAAEAKLDAGLLTQIMNFVPRQPVSPCEKTNHETSRLP